MILLVIVSTLLTPLCTAFQLMASEVINGNVPAADVTMNSNSYARSDYMRFQSDGIDDRLFAVCSNNKLANNIKLFSPQTTELKAKASLTEGVCWWVTFKEDFKLFASASNTIAKRYFLLQRTVGSSTYAMNLLKIDTTTGFLKATCYTASSTSIISCANKDFASKVDMNNLLETTSFQYITGSLATEEVKQVYALPSQNALIVCRYAYYINMLVFIDPASLIKLKTLNSVNIMALTSFYVWTLDNLVADRIFVGSYIGIAPQKCIDSYDLSAPGTTLTKIAGNTYSGANGHILNFGSYNYILMIPSLHTTTNLLVFDKATLVIEQNILLENLESGWDGTIGIDPFHNDTWYIGALMRSSKQVYMYSLYVENCTTRVDRICQQCPQDTYLTNTSINNRCIHKSFIPNAYGISSQNTIERCMDPNCLDCLLNISVCSQCSSDSYLLIKGKCVARSTVKYLLLDKTAWSKSIAEIYFDDDIDAGSLDISKMVITVHDDVNNEDILCTQCSIKTVHPNGFSLEVKIDRSVLKGHLKIMSNDITMIRTSNLKKIFKDFPIIIRDFYNEREVLQKLKSSIDTSMDVTSGLNGPASLLLMASSPAAATFIDRVGCTLLYLYLLRGPFVSYPDKVLSNTFSLNIGPLPFHLDKLLEAAISNRDRRRQQETVKAGRKASLFATRGSSLILIGVTLVLVLIISEVCRLLIKRNKFTKKCEFIRETYGLKYFLAKMDGIQLELFIFSLHHLRFPSRSLEFILGAVLAAAIFLYYSAVALLNLRLVLFITKAGVTPTSIDKIDGIDSIKYKILLYQFKDISIDGKYYKLLHYPVYTLRNILVSVFIICINVPVIQLLLILPLEAFHLVYILGFCNKTNKIQRYTDLVTNCSLVLYLLVKCMTVGDIDERTRQNNLGMTMMILLALMILTCISFVFVTIVIMIVYLVKKFREKKLPISVSPKMNVISSSQLHEKVKKKQRGSFATPFISPIMGPKKEFSIFDSAMPLKFYLKDQNKKAKKVVVPVPQDSNQATAKIFESPQSINALN